MSQLGIANNCRDWRCHLMGSIPKWMSLISVVLLGSVKAFASLDMDNVHAAFGDDFEVIKEIPGRPWVEVQHRYERDGVMISCNFVGQRCLWIDYWSKGKQIDEQYMFSELEKLFPGESWLPEDKSSKQHRWMNRDEDRLTLRSTGFTLHMNEYIRNVLSRRAQWQF